MSVSSTGGRNDPEPTDRLGSLEAVMQQKSKFVQNFEVAALSSVHVYRMYNQSWGVRVSGVGDDVGGLSCFKKKNVREPCRAAS